MSLLHDCSLAYISQTNKTNKHTLLLCLWLYANSASFFFIFTTTIIIHLTNNNIAPQRQTNTLTNTPKTQRIQFSVSHTHCNRNNNNNKKKNKLINHSLFISMGPERSKSLHNFSFPSLKWGSQKFLRCVNVTSQNHQPQPSSVDHRSSPSQSKFHQPHISKIQPFPSPNHKPNNDDDDDDVQEKRMVDPEVMPKKLKVSILEEEGAVNARPWNLRTRRAACKAPQSTKTTPPHEEKNKLFDLGFASSPVKEKKKKINEIERAKFEVSLSKEEVKSDFLALVGTKPPRRPKKRPRIVQRQLDTLFPGLWLTEVTAESYKVPDVPE